MSNARRAAFEVNYEHANITDDIKGNVKGMTYTDIASGESDTISLILHDREGNWIGGWLPEKGDHISASVFFNDWEHEGDYWALYCGLFEIDDISGSGPPVSFNIGGISIPRSTAFNEEERTKNWESVTVEEIAGEIALRAGISLYYDAEEISVKSLEQDKQTDCKFLYQVCEKYGLAMKVFAEKIVIFDEAVYESAPPLADLKREDFARYSFRSKLEGTYTGAKIAYTDPGTSETHIVMVGGGDRIKEINEEADSAPDAQKKAIAALNNANKDAETFSGTIMSKKELTASGCVKISGFGEYDGIYYLDKVTTKIGNNGASQQSFEAHKTGYRMDNAKVVIDNIEETRESGNSGEYVVKKGDTLWKIAEEMLGSPLRYAEIYNLNKSVIEETAQGRGKKDSGNGHWIFQGTTLQIPSQRVDE